MASNKEAALEAPVAPVKPQKPKRFWRILTLTVILVAVLLLTCWMVYHVYMDNDSFQITFYRVGSDDLKANMRTVLISDLHMASYGENNDELIDAVARLRPDFISVTGDVNTYGDPDGVAFAREFCKRLVAIAPTYYAMGNHEVDVIIRDNIDFKAELTKAGVTLLNNKVVTTEINGNVVSIGGLTQHYAERAKYAPKFIGAMTGAEGYRVLLTHYPQSFLEGLCDEDVDLAMCGHAHGGQIRLPFVGALYTPDQGLFPKLTDGVYDYEYMTLVVSRGLGNSGSIPRVNNPPELVVVDIVTY